MMLPALASVVVYLLAFPNSRPAHSTCAANRAEYVCVTGSIHIMFTLMSEHKFTINMTVRLPKLYRHTYVYVKMYIFSYMLNKLRLNLGFIETVSA